MHDISISVFIALVLAVLVWGGNMTFKGLFGRTTLIKGIKFNLLEFVITIAVIAVTVLFLMRSSLASLEELEELYREGIFDYDTYLRYYYSRIDSAFSNVLLFLLPLCAQFFLPPVGTFFEDGLLLNKVIPYEDIVSYEIMDKKIEVEYMVNGAKKKQKIKYRDYEIDEIEGLLRQGIGNYLRRTMRYGTK